MQAESISSGWGIIIPYLILAILAWLVGRAFKFFGFWTPRAKLMKQLLLDETRSQFPPRLRDLAFEACYPDAKIQLKEIRPGMRPTNKYVRIRDGGIDVIAINWMRWGHPKFTIAFDRVLLAGATDFSEVVRSAVNAPSNYLVPSGNWFDVWFMPGWIGSFLRPEAEARQCVRSCIQRLDDIDAFVRTGARLSRIRSP
jgi:hypothetical protein